MKKNNVCKFPAQQEKTESLTIINFVFEQDLAVIKRPKILATYAINCVASGSAVLLLDNKEYRLSVGDVFFVIPGVKFSISGDTDFSYYYISFLGKRAQKHFDELAINRQNPVRYALNDALDAFKLGIQTATPSNLNLVCESLLLFSFASIKKRQELTVKVKENKLISEIRLYIDENFSNENLTLKSVSERFSYNPKYLSSLFNEVVKTPFSAYLTRLRINYAVALIEQGVTSVKDIAFMCGFKDPLYFSKVFKKRTGKSPSEYKK